MTAGLPTTATQGLRLALAALLAALLLPALTQAAKPGDLDRSFGHDGWVRTGIDGHDRASGVTIDSKGRIVAAGSAGDYGEFGIARYRRSGRLDHSFSEDGKVTTDFRGSGIVFDWANSVAIDSKGRIVAAGAKCTYDDYPQEGGTVIGCDAAIARYMPDGSPDPSFGGDGRVARNLGDSSYPSSVAIGANDRIVIAAGDVVARFRQNGTFDPTFGTDGTTTPAHAHLSSMAIDPRGRIVAVGWTGPHNGYRFIVERFLSDGAPDLSFGNGGKVIRREEGLALAVAITPKDQILVAGGTLAHSGEPGDFRLAFYREDGTRRRHWGDNGEVLTSFRDRSSARVVSVGFDSRGRIVAIGGIGSVGPGRHDEYALARYHRNGTLDRSFSGNGKAKGQFAFPHRSRHAGYVNGGTVDSRDGMIVAGGESHFLLARFIGYPRHRWLLAFAGSRS